MQTIIYFQKLNKKSILAIDNYGKIVYNIANKGEQWKDYLFIRHHF